MEPRRHSDFDILRRLFQQAYPLRRLVAGVFLLNVLAAPLALLTPLPLKVLVDHVLDTQPLPSWLAWLTPASLQASQPAMLVLSVSLVVFIALLVQAQTLAKWVCESLTSEKLVLQFRSRLFRHVQRLSLLYHDRAGSTDPLYRIQYDAPAIQWVLVHGLTPFFTSGLTVLGMLYIAGGIHWQMAAVAGAVAPVLFALSEYHRRRIRARWYELKQVETSSMSVLEETLGAIRVVQAFGQEDRQLAAYEGHATAGVTRHVSLAWIDGSFGALAALVIAAGTALALYLGAQHVQAGMLTLGELLIVMTYIAQLHTPMKAISGQIGTLQGSLVSAERAFALLDQAPDVVDNPRGQPIARATGGVEFRNVSFAYEPGHPVLENISLCVPVGSRVGIAGTTGAGKTTLVSLLTRMYDPTSGQVLLDGTDMRGYRLAHLRNQFAIVLQEPVLFSSSIAENIAYARPDASPDAIIAAARAANAHDFITRLPQGYDTLVGQRGARLSGGERQRVSLARAFLKDAPVLVLDEPTSSVDTRTEAIIMEAMDRLMTGRTTFMIAHRVSTLETCDIRLHLERGRIVPLADPGRVEGPLGLRRP